MRQPFLLLDSFLLLNPLDPLQGSQVTGGDDIACSLADPGEEGCHLAVSCREIRIPTLYTIRHYPGQRTHSRAIGAHQGTTRVTLGSMTRKESVLICRRGDVKIPHSRMTKKCWETLVNCFLNVCGRSQKAIRTTCLGTKFLCNV